MKNARVPVAVARKDFAKLLARAEKRGARIKVTRYGTTLAGIISRADLSQLEECDDVLAKRRVHASRTRPRTRRTSRG